eukprot:scaffold609_cov130-Cylindrotheca_fusiformis.AAC.4
MAIGHANVSNLFLPPRRNSEPTIQQQQQHKPQVNNIITFCEGLIDGDGIIELLRALSSRFSLSSVFYFLSLAIL